MPNSLCQIIESLRHKFFNLTGSSLPFAGALPAAATIRPGSACDVPIYDEGGTQLLHPDGSPVILTPIFPKSVGQYLLGLDPDTLAWL
jgi:hypothetical protein